MRFLTWASIVLIINCLFCFSICAQDIALVGKNATLGADRFSFVALKNIPSGDVYYFTDDAYDPATNTFDVASVESLFGFTSPGLVTGDVIVVTEGTTSNTIVETCESTVTCGATVTLIDPTFSITTSDELFCFTSTMPITATAQDIAGNIDEIHASIRGSGVTNPSIPTTANYPNAVNVTMTVQEGQFNVGTRATVLTTSDLSIASNFVSGNASSPVRFTQLNGSTVSGPEIQLTDIDGSVINNGSPSGSCANSTFFPITGILGGSSYSYAYEINNLGTAVLNLTGNPVVTISGDPAFTLGSLPTNTSIAVSSSELFSVVFAPTTLGTHSATITIMSNDADEGTTTFVVEGEATPDNLAPAIALTGMASAADQFSFVALRDIQPGEIFYFTDDNYDELANEFIHVGGVESLFKFEPAALVPEGNVYVVSEGTAINSIVLTCTDQLCDPTDVILVDSAFSFVANDALYCFTSSSTSTAPDTILANIEQIHASMAFASNTDYIDATCRYGTTCHVKLPSNDAQFTVSLRENTMLTDKAAFENPANYTSGNASSTVPFNRDVLGCGDNLYDNGGDTAVYAANSMDSYTFCPDNPGDVVTIEFTFVDIEASSGSGNDNTGCWDYLTLYNGDSNAATLIGTFCGEGDGDGSKPSLPANYVQAGNRFVADNPSGCLTITFQSDNIVQEQGFESMITCGPPTTCSTMPGDDMATAIPLTAHVYDQNYNLECYTNAYSGLTGSDIYFKYTSSNCSDSLFVGTCGPSTDFNSVIYLLDAAGTVLTSNDDFVSGSYGCSVLKAKMNPSTDYFIVIDNYSEAISQLDFTFFNFRKGDTLNNTKVVGSLPFSDIESNTSPCFNDKYDTNGNGGNDVFYKFVTGPCADSIRISTCSDTTDFDTYITLLDSTGASLFDNDDALNSSCNILLNGLNRFSIIHQPVMPNTVYYVVVDGYEANAAGTYELTIEETIQTNILGTTDTTAIALSGNIFNQVYSTECTDDNYTGRSGNDMFFTFAQRPTCSDSVFISTCSDTTNFDTYIYLIDDTGTVVASNDDAAPGTCQYQLDGLNRFSTIRALLDAGKTYTIVVDGFNASAKGTFGLTYYTYRHGNAMGDPILVPSLPYTDVNNNTCYSNIFDPINTNARDVYYKFTTGPCADTINITTCSNTSFNTFLYLLNEDGTQKYNNNDFCGQQSRIRAAITPNTTYFLVVDGFTQPDLGSFELTIEEICRPGVIVSPKLFLEGAYDSGAGLMYDDLRIQNLIPAVEPFTGLGFTHINGGGGEQIQTVGHNASGNDATVDWVFVELRDATDPTVIIATRSAILQRDGDVVQYEFGTGGVEFTNIPDGNYYVAVRTRNHLAVCSATDFSLSQTTNTTVDFTGGVAFGTNAMRSYPGGEFALYEGDIDASGTINAADRSDAWNNRNTVGVYLQADSNLDGNCTATERSNIWNNRNLSAQLP